MRKLISLMDVSLGGYCGGSQEREGLDRLHDAIFSDANEVIHNAGAAVYSRVTPAGWRRSPRSPSRVPWKVATRTTPSCGARRRKPSRTEIAKAKAS